MRNCEHFGQEGYNSKWSWQTGNKSEKGDCNSVRTCARYRCRATSMHTSWGMFSWQLCWKGSETTRLTGCMWVNSINAIGKKHTWLSWRRLIKLLFYLFYFNSKGLPAILYLNQLYFKRYLDKFQSLTKSNRHGWNVTSSLRIDRKHWDGSGWRRDQWEKSF